MILSQLVTNMASETVSQLTPPLQEEEIVKMMSDEAPLYKLFKLGFLDSISFKLFGYKKLGSLSQGSNIRDVYIFNCETHGVQIATPCGWANRLVCNSCLSDAKTQMNKKDKVATTSDQIDSVKTLNKYLTKNSNKNK